MTKLKYFLVWFKSFWFRPLPAQPVSVMQPTQDITPKADAPRRKHKKEKSETLSSLLDNLEYTFEAMKIDYEEMSLMGRGDIEGLKKFGVSVIPNSLNEVPMISKVNNEIGLSSIIFLAHTEGKKGDKDFMYPDFFYAIKQKKCPWFVAKKSGAIYNCGFGYRDVILNKTFWVSFYTTINKDGEVLPTHYLAHKEISTPQGRYTKRQWQLSTWKNWNSKEKDENSVVTSMVAYHFNLWGSRKSMWSTTVERDGVRAIFYVDHRDTKTYFKNREKTVTENGATRRIIHLVEEHERKYQNGNVAFIPEHVRGLNKFLWNGFKCSVASPVHHLDARSIKFASEDIDEKDFFEKYMSTSEMADMVHSKTGTRIKDLHKERA